MADLDGLIRYRKHIVDERQKILAQLFRQYEEIEEYKQSVLAQVDHEIEAAKVSEDLDVQSQLGLFVNASHNKVKKLELAQAKLDVKIAKAQDAVREAFAEQKKAEIVQRSRQKEERRKENKKESDELNEVAIEGFRRRMHNEEDGELDTVSIGDEEGIYS